ncbi:MAG: DUF2339 domain-containing protein, partial [Luteimonas sp.]
MEALILLLGLALLAVPVLLVVALVMIGDLRRRVRELEDRTQRRPQEAQPRQAGPSVPHSVAPEPARPEASMPPAPAPSPASAPRPRSEATLPPRPPVAETPVRTVPLSQQLETATRRANEDGAGARLLRWFTTGNVIAKVGMLVLLAGVAALLKYASDQGWLAVPIGWRLAGVAAAALVGLGFGWRQREARPAFALTLQGGAIGVLLLVVFAAFQRYDLMPAAPAFALSVALVAALCVLAVLQ